MAFTYPIGTPMKNQLARPASTCAAHPVPFNVSTAEAIRLFGSVKLFRRMRHAGWIRPLEPSAPGRPSLYPFSRLVAAQERLERGDFPPLLPSDARLRHSH